MPWKESSVTEALPFSAGDRHLARPVEMIGMHEVEIGRQRVDVGDHRERQIGEPDVLPHGLPGVGRLRDQVACEVIDVVPGEGLRGQVVNARPWILAEFACYSANMLNFAAESPGEELDRCFFPQPRS